MCSQKTVAGSQFGVPLQNLVPPNTIKVPTVLEVCLHFLEANGAWGKGGGVRWEGGGGVRWEGGKGGREMRGWA